MGDEAAFVDSGEHLVDLESCDNDWFDIMQPPDVPAMRSLARGRSLDCGVIDSLEFCTSTDVVGSGDSVVCSRRDGEVYQVTAEIEAVVDAVESVETCEISIFMQNTYSHADTNQSMVSTYFFSLENGPDSIPAGHHSVVCSDVELDARASSPPQQMALAVIFFSLTCIPLIQIFAFSSFFETFDNAVMNYFKI